MLTVAQTNESDITLDPKQLLGHFHVWFISHIDLLETQTGSIGKLKQNNTAQISDNLFLNVFICCKWK